MREIEFRGYDLDLKKWFYGGYHKHIKRQIAPFGDELKEEDIQHMIIIDGFADWNMPKPIQVVTNIDKNSLGQYTGVKDKKRIKIYEGDIVMFEGILYKVIYTIEECRFILVDKDNNERVLGNWRSHLMEVIGNIFENPKLLEVENER